jgi:hypothetical protein
MRAEPSPQHRSITASQHHTAQHNTPQTRSRAAAAAAAAAAKSHASSRLHSGDWSDWEETWRRHDHDKDGNIKVNVGEVSCAVLLCLARRLTRAPCSSQITRLFTEHYNILHDRLEHDKKPGLTSIGHGRAGDPTFVVRALALGRRK